jgi:hypothetical protein
VRPSETNRETSDGLTVSPVPPPIRGDGETNHETDPLAAYLQNPPTWFVQQADACVREESPDRLVTPLAASTAGEVFGTVTRYKEAEPSVREYLKRLGDGE